MTNPANAPAPETAAASTWFRSPHIIGGATRCCNCDGHVDALGPGFRRGRRAAALSRPRYRRDDPKRFRPRSATPRSSGCTPAACGRKTAWNAQAVSGLERHPNNRSCVTSTTMAHFEQFHKPSNEANAAPSIPGPADHRRAGPAGAYEHNGNCRAGRASQWQAAQRSNDMVVHPTMARSGSRSRLWRHQYLRGNPGRLPLQPALPEGSGVSPRRAVRSGQQGRRRTVQAERHCFQPRLQEVYVSTPASRTIPMPTTWSGVTTSTATSYRIRSSSST